MFFLFFQISCFQGGDDIAKKLTHYSFENSRQHFLPSALREISGLAFNNGVLYAHNDEKGTVYLIDVKTGRMLKEFNIGARPLKKDFEGIAVAGNNIYMATSSGVIYEFKEPDSSHAEFNEYKTPLTVDYDIEGLCYEESSNSLLIVCKDYPKKSERNVRGVFSFDLSTKKMTNKPRFIISLNELQERFEIKNFSPSSIEIHANGDFYILSSNEKAVAVFSPEGKLIEAVKLPAKHMQPEGLTFLNNNDMIISDEGGKDDAELTIYPFIPAADEK